MSLLFFSPFGVVYCGMFVNFVVVKRKPSHDDTAHNTQTTFARHNICYTAIHRLARSLGHHAPLCACAADDY